MKFWCYNMDESWEHIREISQMQSTNILWFHLKEVSRIGKLIKSKK